MERWSGSNMRIGVIAEEVNDVDVLYEFTCKLIDERAFSFKKFVGHGCGRLRRKCAAWATNLLARGCTHLVVLHDLDRYAESVLRAQLEDCVKDVGFDAYVILIPIREIEAWLLVDANALQSVFNMTKRPKLPNKPEAVLRPKKKLRDIVWKTAKKHYVHSIHNRKIAAASRLAMVKSCVSFGPYPRFITAQAI
jgi:hypothetical protein